MSESGTRSESQLMGDRLLFLPTGLIARCLLSCRLSPACRGDGVSCGSVVLRDSADRLRVDPIATLRHQKSAAGNRGRVGVRVNEGVSDLLDEVKN